MSYRSSAERLLKRAIAGQPLPSINSLVDLYTMVSLETGLCLGWDDLDRTSGGLAFRFSRPDDSFLGGSERSAQGRRGRLRRRSPGPLPSVEPAPGRAHRLQPRDLPRSPHRPVELRRRQQAVLG
jgi:B3/4 domain